MAGKEAMDRRLLYEKTLFVYYKENSSKIKNIW